jgi:phosphate transport system permease protein
VTTTSTPAGQRNITLADLAGDRKRLRTNNLIAKSLFASAAVSIIISVLILWSLFSEAWRFVFDLNKAGQLGALFDSLWSPRQDRFSLSTIIVGTLVTSFVAMIVALPVGLGAAVYLAEYARPRVRRVLKPILEVLAGIPSVVLGFFALRVLGPDLIQPLFNTDDPKNMLVTGVAIGILVVPLMASISEDSMRAVPDALREASFGMGARKISTVVRVVLPAAISGITAAFIIATSRAIGETMVAAMASGRVGQAPFELDPRQPGLTMTAAMAQSATGSDNVVGTGLTFTSLFFVGLLLFFFTLGLNVLADRFVQRVRNVY